MRLDRVNLSFYRFCRLGDEQQLSQLCARLKDLGRELALKGKILISPEGVNAMVSGSSSSIEALKRFCLDNMGVQSTDFKEAPDKFSSFNKLLVKIKKHIITVGDDEVQPDVETGPRLSPKQLKEWLDEGKPLILLDARNQYEIETGTFQNAQSFEIDASRDFTKKAGEHLEELKSHSQDRPIVTFCTGGVRCEKASAVLLKLGLKNIYQLDGGIIRYFEENGAKHFNGNCFVFDWRLAVNGDLEPVARSEDPNEDFGRHRARKKRISQGQEV